MIKRQRASVVMLFLAAFVATGALVTNRIAAGASADKEAIRSLLESAYFNGAFNDQNTDAMASGFHKDFAIFSAREDELARYEIATWISGIKKRKSESGFDPSSAAMDGKIVALDVTGGAASAKIELRRKGTLVYTDYLSFLKFKSGWKIAAKVYHRHPTGAQ